MGCAAYGNDEIVTPNMDRLAREGARFTHAFAASGVCTPSRVAHLTGLFPIHVGLTDVPYRDPREGLPSGVPTWPRVLQQNGYRTGLVGKWHLGRAPEHHPTHFGLDYFFGFLGGSNRPQNPILSRDGKTVEVNGYTPDIFVDDAMRFIERNQSRPFALMLHFRAPHAPHLPVPEADLKPFKALDPTVPMVDPAVARLDDDQEPADPEAIALHRRLLKQKMVTYYASVHSVDRNLGRLLQQLDDLDLTRKTIVVFTSDHGYMFGHRGMKGKGAAQPIRNHTLDEDVFFVNMYDESFQVPLIIRWPDVVEGGRVIDELVSNVDFFPTFLGMVGVPVPEGLSLQGQDFSPLLRGEDVSWRDVIFAEYTPQQIGVVEFIRMVRTKKWKLVRRYLNPGGNQLFDLGKRSGGDSQPLLRGSDSVAGGCRARPQRGAPSPGDHRRAASKNDRLAGVHPRPGAEAGGGSQRGQGGNQAPLALMRSTFHVSRSTFTSDQPAFVGVTLVGGKKGDSLLSFRC